MENKTCENFSIPVLGLGTWGIGGGREIDTTNDDENIQIIKDAIKMGYTHLDTAEMYGLGHTEELVGEAIKEFNRNDLFITTKVTNTHLRYNDVITAAKGSLKRMQTDYIDLYLIHAPNPEIPIEETMRAMNDLVKQGLVKFIGVSNFTMEAMIDAQKVSEAKIVANQIEYSLLTRNRGKYSDNHDMESKTIPYCQENGIIIMAERPLERGLLLEPQPVLDRMAKKYKKTRAQIAINWLISKNNVITIPKSSNIKHLKENMGALDWNLSKKDMIILDSANFGDVPW